MEIAKPQLLWLLVLVPVAGGLVYWAWRRRLAAAAAWAGRGLWDRLLPGYDKRRQNAAAFLAALAVLGVVLALARPRWGQSTQKVERQGLDIVFVLDTSLSMATRDVAPSRLWVAQTLIRRLVRNLPGHRMALVQAEGDGVALVPLTGDTAVIQMLLDAVQPGSMPLPGSELARALRRALELFPEAESKHQVMILVSDGEDHGSNLEGAAAALTERSVVLHAIGVGTPDGMPLELPGTNTGRIEYKHDQNGQVVVSRLVEATLEDLTRTTGGLYLRAQSAGDNLTDLLERIEDVDKRAYASDVVSTREERFQWPITLAIVALLIHLLVAPFGRGEKPR